MLPKIHRLSNEKDFKRVFKIGRGSRCGFLTLRWLEAKKEFSRFGFIVSNKISNKAAIRHLIKRRLRESIKSKLDRIKPGHDYVIIVAPEIENKNYREIDKEVERLLEKTGLMDIDGY